MLRLGCLVLVVLLVAIPVVAGQFLPWWGTLLVVVAEAAALILLGPKLIGYGIKRMAIGLFMTKSRVLQGAMAHVYGVTLLDAPPPDILADDVDDEDDDETDAADTSAPAEPGRYVQIDVLITPRDGASRMTHWEPDEMMLVPFDAKVDMETDPTDDGLAASARAVSLVDESGAAGENPGKIAGPARLQMIFQCPATLKGRAKFRYYFETFGDLVLP